MSKKSLSRNDMEDLLKKGLAYVYSPDRWKELKTQEGKCMPSPSEEAIIRGQKVIKELIQPMISPMVLNEREVSQLENLARAWKVFNALQVKIIEKGLQGDRRFTELVKTIVPEDQRALVLKYIDHPSILPYVRLDMIRTSQGFQVVDINVTRPAGVGANILLEEAYRTLGYQDFGIGGVFCKSILGSIEKWNKQSEHLTYLLKIRIAIIAEGVNGDWYDYHTLSEVLEKQESVQSVEIVTEIPDDSLERYDVILRGRIKQGHPQFEQLDALSDQSICVLSPLGNRYLGNKYWFFAFRMPELKSYFQEEMGTDYDVLDAAIPETGFLHNGIVIFPDRSIAASELNRKEWLLKPPSGSSAKGIIIGTCISQTKWLKITSSPETNGAIVQFFYGIKEDIYVLDAEGNPTVIHVPTKYGAFLFDGLFGGCEVMARRGSYLVHGARDTYLGACTYSQYH